MNWKVAKFVYLNLNNLCTFCKQSKQNWCYVNVEFDERIKNFDKDFLLFCVESCRILLLQVECFRHFEAFWALLSFVEPCWAFSSLLESFWALLSLFEPRWALLSLVEPCWILLSLVELSQFKTKLSFGNQCIRLTKNY